MVVVVVIELWSLPANIATGAPSGSACVDWDDVCGVVSGFSFQSHHVSGESERARETSQLSFDKIRQSVLN